MTIVRMIPFFYFEAVYYVFADGRVTNRFGKNMKQELNRPGPNGRLRVRLRSPGHPQKWFYVARLVLELYDTSCPFPGAQGRHLDGDPMNNFYTNLAWGTAKENSDDKLRHGSHPSQIKRKKAHV